MTINITATPKKLSPVIWGVLCPTKPKKGDVCLVTARSGKQWICIIDEVYDKTEKGWEASTLTALITVDKKKAHAIAEFNFWQGI